MSDDDRGGPCPSDERGTPSEPDPHPLDEVIWRALTGVQENFAEGDERARCYPAALAPFAATRDTEPASFRSLLALVSGDDRIALFTTEEVTTPSAFSVIRGDSVDQMVLEDAGACAAQPGTPIVALGVADVPEMLALAGVTQPGPFGPRTIELGDYIGIRQRGVLVAMAGERMRLDGFTEISAVCVEPTYRGHGFAVDLVGSLVSSIAARSEIPFLHVFKLSRSRTIVDPARERLLETRKLLVSTWMKAAEVLDAKREIILAGDVRCFASHLPSVLTDRQRLAAQFIGFIEKQRGTQRDGPGRIAKHYDLAR